MARKKHSMMKATMFITLIITLNLVGISYGHWQDGLTNEIQFSTGYMNPDFYNKVEVKESGDFNKSKAVLKTDKKAGSKYIKLTGEIYRGQRGKLKLNYSVINNGNLPIAFDNEVFEELNQQIKGLKIRNKPSKKVLYPDAHPTDSLVLQIDAPEKVDDYEFEIKIPYKQWTGN